MSEKPTALSTPGAIGRLFRVAVGAAELCFVVPLATGWRDTLWAGRLPTDIGFFVLAGLALLMSSWVIRILANRPWGQKPVVVLVAGSAGAAGVGYLVYGSPIALPLTLYLWGWFAALIAVLGPAHVLAGVLAVPGCEMRVYAHIVARLRGRDVEHVVCPGGIDRFDHIGSPAANDDEPFTV